MTTSQTFEDRLLERLQLVVAANPAPPTPTARRTRPNRFVVAGAGATAVCAGIAAMTVLGGGTSSAYALETQPDGSVTVHIKSLSDASGLQRSLRAAGIPAVVDYKADCAPTSATAPADGGPGPVPGHFDTGPSLRQAGPKPKGDLSRMKVTSSVRSDAGGVTFTLDPGQVAGGQRVFITTSTGRADSIAIAIGETAPEVPPCPPAPGQG